MPRRFFMLEKTETRVQLMAAAKTALIGEGRESLLTDNATLEAALKLLALYGDEINQENPDWLNEPLSQGETTAQTP